MHHRTDLAAGQVTNHDRVLIELVERPDSPAFIAINWPLKASVSTVEAFPTTAAKAAAFFAQASTKLQGSAETADCDWPAPSD
jgi:hypothetical protein